MSMAGPTRFTQRPCITAASAGSRAGQCGPPTAEGRQTQREATGGDSARRALHPHAETVPPGLRHTEHIDIVCGVCVLEQRELRQYACNRHIVRAAVRYGVRFYLRRSTACWCVSPPPRLTPRPRSDRARRLLCPPLAVCGNICCTYALPCLGEARPGGYGRTTQSCLLSGTNIVYQVAGPTCSPMPGRTL